MASSNRELRYLSRSPEATQALAGAIARHVRIGHLLALVGPLGAGKTCFVAGLAMAMGVRGRVASPSFIIARFHDGPTPLVHADAYRLARPEEILDAGLDEWLQQAVVAVEWADRVAEVLPDDRLVVTMTVDGHLRHLNVAATGPSSAAIVENLRHEHTCHRNLEFTG